jgi:SMC interacting uncharacterized protein involved in chromosome segregation
MADLYVAADLFGIPTDVLLIGALIMVSVVIILLFFVFLYQRQTRRIDLKGIQKVLKEDEKEQAMQAAIQESIRGVDSKVVELERETAESKEMVSKEIETAGSKVDEVKAEIATTRERTDKSADKIRDDIGSLKNEIGQVEKNLEEQIEELKVGEETLAEALDAMKGDVNAYITAVKHDVSSLSERLGSLEEVISSVERMQIEEMETQKRGGEGGEHFKILKTDVAGVKKNLESVMNRVKTIAELDKKGDASLNKLGTIKSDLSLLNDRMDGIEEEMLGFLGLMEEKLKAEGKKGKKKKYTTPVIEYLNTKRKEIKGKKGGK